MRAKRQSRRLCRATLEDFGGLLYRQAAKDLELNDLHFPWIERNQALRHWPGFRSCRGRRERST
jgi:hypothetical protein